MAEAQLLDALIDLRDFELLLESDPVALLAQVGAEQVRQILHRLLGEPGVGARQRSYGVHAVEEEMWADASLQRVHARRCLHLHVAAPLVSHIEVAQRKPCDHEADRDIAPQESPRIRGKQPFGPDSDDQLGTAGQERAARHRRNHRRDEPEHYGGSPSRAHARQPLTQPAQERRSGKTDPQQKERGARKIRPEIEAGTLTRERQHDRRELDDEDYPQGRA